METKYVHFSNKIIFKHLYGLMKILPAVLLLVFVCPLFIVNAQSHDRGKHFVFGPKKFEREKGKPKIESVSFRTHEGGSNFTMKIENGGWRGRNRVSSAQIILNGEEVFSSSDFNQQTGILERRVSLKPQNVLKVKLNGKHDSFIFIAITKTGSGQPSDVTVPNIVGLGLEAARNDITSASLTIGTITNAYSSTVPNGSVISQNPASGASVAKGSAIALTVSQGAASVLTPNVVGMNQANAQAAFTVANLVLGTVSYAYSTTVAEGNVISQSPASGTLVQPGSTVNIVASSGPPPVSVPNLSSMTQADAQSAITAVALAIGNITTANSSTVPAGSVISQTPAAGTSVSQGTAIALVISSGSATATVPNIVGMTQANAQSVITTANLTVGTITTASSSTVASGSIISQTPSAGASVAQGAAIALVVSSGPVGVVIPPDPVTVAPPVDGTVATTVAAGSAFLYSGDNPIQTGVAPGTIEVRRAAVLRGQVNDRDGRPLSGVVVTVLNHPEFGQTISRNDGMFDMAVNGGGILTVNYEKTGYLPSHRQINAPWQDYAWLPVVSLIPVDVQVTSINLASATQPQVHRGNVVTDKDGTRQATLLFSPGTTAQMVMFDGSKQSVSSLNIRATEYTVGPNGPSAMPGALPPASGYTYAVELSGDEAIASGATQITFNQPVYFYVDNFLNFPVGGVVPVGYYDRKKAAWIPSDNGRIIKILSIANGLAELDVDGSGQPADAAKLAALNVTDTERQKLATLYLSSKTLWRSPLTHFSPWDCNWPWGFPGDATTPTQPKPVIVNPTKNPCEKGGSIIECQNQVLGERLNIPGTPYTLNYRSSRVLGHTSDYTVNIPLSGANVPASIKRIDLIVQVAGRQFSKSFPAAPNQSYTFTWDGKDAYGRTLQGKQPATVQIGYVYELVYVQPNNGVQSFGSYSDTAISLGANTSRETGGEATLWQTEQFSIGGLLVTFDAHSQGLGGWGMNIHHSYDPVGKVLLLGDGSLRFADSISSGIITTMAGNGTQSYSGDGGPATNAGITASDVAVGPDGRIYIADAMNNRIRRIDIDGIITTVAGNGTQGYNGDSGPATSASLYYPNRLALGSDGSIYIADLGNSRIRRVGIDGNIMTVAGNGTQGYSGDGGPATSASLDAPYGVALGSDGSIYIADLGNSRIRRVGTDGTITTVAGNGIRNYSGDGGPATSSSVSLNLPRGVAVGPDGSIYTADEPNSVIRRVGPDGIISTVAGNHWYCYNDCIMYPNSVAVGSDGSIYIPSTGRILRVGTDGVMSTVAGTDYKNGFSGDGGYATSASFGFYYTVAISPDGSIYIADTDNNRIRRVTSYFPSVSTTDISIPSEDSSQLYIFNSSGKHQRTVNAMTGATIFTFNYDTNGKLTTVTDGSGNITTITRDASGNPTTIVAPFGQRTALTLDTNGYLASVTDPGNNTTRMTYSDSGLMATFTDPKNNIHNFTYDAMGQLMRDENPASGYTALTSTYNQTSKQTVLSTALGRTSTYLTEYLSTGDQRQTITTPTGGQSVMLTMTNGNEQTTSPDGTTSSVTLGIDPRFGSQVYIPASSTIQTPAGLTRTTTLTRTATLADNNNLFSLSPQTDTLTVNSRVYTSQFDAAQKTYTITTPTGRKLTALTDSLGKPLSLTLDPAITPITISYDVKGRLIQAAQGNQQLSYGYDSLGRVASRSDALGNASNYAYNSADRLTLFTLPSGNKYGFAYDANGNRTQITMPNGAVHALGYTVIDLGSSYTPPGNLPYTWQYSLDQEWLRTTLPGGRTVDAGYDSGGRPLGIVYPEATVSLNYGDNTGRISHLIRTTSIIGSANQAISLTYDGSLVTGRNYTGAASGQFTYSYDNSFFLSQIKLTSGTDNVTTPITRDADGLVTGYGPFTYTRTGPAGALSGITGPALNSTVSYDNMGRLSQRTYTVNGASIYSIQLGYDSRGNISSKTETVSGTTTTQNYSYDADGQLVNTKINGVSVEEFTYDVNGNRTGYKQPNWNLLSDFDTQDRVVRVGGTLYQFNADGQLTQRNSDTFQYSAQGELLKATVSGQNITYSYDGGHRLTARTDSSGTSQYLYSSIKNPFQLTAMRDPAGVLTYYYYDDTNKLFAFDKGTTRFYVATDQLGTPKVISDAIGTVVKIMEYDSFGWATFDSNPSFSIPVGFAGGIADSKTRLVRFGYRDYEPETGRWAAKDPIFFGGGQGNLYQYVKNNPVNWTDPSGLWIPQAIGAAINLGFEGHSQYQSGNLDPGRLFVATVTGALGGFGNTAVKAMAFGASANIFNTGYQQLGGPCQSLNAEKLARSGAYGAAGSLFGFGLGEIGSRLYIPSAVIGSEVGTTAPLLLGPYGAAAGASGGGYIANR